MGSEIKSIILTLCGISFFTACTAPTRDPQSEVRSQIGNDESIQLSASDSSGIKHGAVGILAPLGCTGWFVSKKFFVTNQHCVTRDTTMQVETGLTQFDPSYCAQMTVQMDHYKDRPQGLQPVEHKCKKIHLANQAHDVAIVEIQSEFPGEPLQLATQSVEGSEVYLIGHPAGKPKTLSALEGSEYCRLRKISFPEGMTARDAPTPRQGPKYEHSVEHNCDTLGGSSGSPVIEKATGRVVALHWDGWASSAWPHADPGGSRIAKVEIPDPQNPGQRIPFSFRHREGNVGIRIQDIRRLVQQAAATDPAFAEVAALFAP